MSPTLEVFTLGHSTRTLEEFLSILAAQEIRILVDVRRFPGSRRHPHFAREALEPSLADAGIEYVWAPELGGRRRPRKDTPHTAWRVDQFAGYADHMESEEFAAAAQALLDCARRARTVIVCAEAVPERCHRRLIADWLTVRRVSVQHVMAARRLVPHRLTDFARVEGDRIVYDGGQPALL